MVVNIMDWIVSPQKHVEAPQKGRYLETGLL